MPTLREQIEVCEFMPVRVIPTPEDMFDPTRKMRSIVFPNNQVAVDVVNFAEIEDEAESMREFMAYMQRNGYYGLQPECLAQPMINSYAPKRYFIDTDGVLYYNPVITDQSDEVCAKEYCLSYPFKEQKETERYFSITVDYYDEDDVLHEDVVLTSTAAVMFQHAIEHLDGVYIYP